MTIKLKDLKRRALQNPGVRREYEALAAEFEIANEFITARARAGLTQAQLAKRMGTTQSAIARLESGQLPSVKTLGRFALATGTRPQIRLVPISKGAASKGKGRRTSA